MVPAARTVLSRVASAAAAYGAGKFAQNVGAMVGKKLVRRSAQKTMGIPSRLRRKRKGPVLKNYRKRKVTMLEKKIRRVVDAEKPHGTYKKVIPEWKYHVDYAGGTTENVQGVWEFKFCEPLELLDAASVLFNLKTIAKDYTITTNNFANAPDFLVKNAVMTTYLTNTSLVTYAVDVYSLIAAQDTTGGNGAISKWEDSLAGYNASAIKPYDMYVTPADGSREFSRYWTGIKSKKTFVLQPGQKKLVCVQATGMLPIHWEDMQSDGSVLENKKGVTRSLLIVQHMPIGYNSTGNKIGVAAAPYGGCAVERICEFRIMCPDQSLETVKYDLFKYKQFYDTTLGTVVVPNAGGATNAPVLAQ